MRKEGTNDELARTQGWGGLGMCISKLLHGTCSLKEGAHKTAAAPRSLTQFVEEGVGREK